jgi:RNA polymerase sigma-70 factor (ECF subfamily)
LESSSHRAADPGAVAAPSTDARELELLRRTADHDRDAFEALYHIYNRRLARFLTRMTRHPEIAEEVINDTMWVVWQRAGEFRGSSRVSTWIMGIAYRRALKGFRRASVRLVPVGLEQAADVQADASADLDRLEGRQVVAQALAQLPLEQRLVVELTYYLGHSCAEIAEILDCPVNTVKTRMFHARRKLRALLPDPSRGAGP